MKKNNKTITKLQFESLVNSIGASFPSFGGGRTSNYNPIVNALKDYPVQFAAGVDVREVLEFICKKLDIKIK